MTSTNYSYARKPPNVYKKMDLVFKDFRCLECKLRFISFDDLYVHMQIEAAFLKFLSNFQYITFYDVFNYCPTKRLSLPTANQTLQKMEWQLADLKWETQCQVCFAELKTILLTPCGHVCTCLNCSNRLEICLLCRVKIKATAKVFLWSPGKQFARNRRSDNLFQKNCHCWCF